MKKIVFVFTALILLCFVTSCKNPPVNEVIYDTTSFMCGEHRYLEITTNPPSSAHTHVVHDPDCLLKDMKPFFDSIKNNK